MVNIRLRVMLIQEATAVLFGKDTSEAPRFIRQWLNILNIDKQNVAGLSRLNFERASQVMNPCEIYVANVVCRIVVLDLA